MTCSTSTSSTVGTVSLDMMDGSDLEHMSYMSYMTVSRESWERGQPDYNGAASFDNILKKVRLLLFILEQLIFNNFLHFIKFDLCGSVYVPIFRSTRP